MDERLKRQIENTRRALNLTTADAEVCKVLQELPVGSHFSTKGENGLVTYKIRTKLVNIPYTGAQMDLELVEFDPQAPIVKRAYMRIYKFPPHVLTNSLFHGTHMFGGEIQDKDLEPDSWWPRPKK